MSATPATTVPYEKQFDLQATRTCGAACLSMVYRSLGQEVPQPIIWPAIAKKNQYGSMASTTHLMAADALSRGFSAVAIQARDPLRVLRACRDSGLRAILNHRLKPDSPAGHYTVFLDIDETHVTLHDPYFGPARRVAHDVFLELWQPRLPNCEIVGNFLIGIAPASQDSSATEPPTPKPCETCKTPLPSLVQCPRCKNPIALQPLPLLGCLNNACSARLWNYVCCPTCDLTWNFTIDPPRASAGSAASSSIAAAPSVPPTTAAAPIDSPSSSSASSSSESDPIDLSKVFAALDKFCEHILSIPEAANHPDVQKQLEFIKSSKQNLLTARAEALVNRKLHEDQLAAMVQAAQNRQEAHQKKLDELNKPLAPLDGDALARALLKSLGFLS